MIWDWSSFPLLVLDAYSSIQCWNLTESFCAAIAVHIVVIRRKVNIKQDKVKLL